MKRVPGEPQAIHTATWFTPLPTGYQRVGISLWKPRGFKREHWEIKALAPGSWYKTVPPDQYLEYYTDILHRLDPRDVVQALYAIGPNPVMVCYEKPVDIDAGTKFCHRHLVAQWLHDTLGITVQEVGHPELRPFRAFERLRITLPVHASVKAA